MGDRAAQLLSAAGRRAFAQGDMMTPFHNMALTSPDTTGEDVDLHTPGDRGCRGRPGPD